MANDVIVEFGAKIDALTSGVNEVKSQLESLRSSTEGISAGFGKLGDVIKAALSVEAIVSFVERMAELGLQTERTMAMLGMSAAQVGELSGLAKITGTSMEGLALSIERMSLNIQRSTRDAVNPQAEALRVLGLNAKQLIGLPTSEYFDKLHDAVSKFNPSLNLTNAVMAVGGRGIAQIIPLLQLQGAEWNKLKEEIASAKTGLDAAIPGMADTHQQIELMSMSVTSLGAVIFSALKPAIDGVIGSFKDFVTNVRDMIKDGGALAGTFNLMAFAAKSLATVVALLTSGVLELALAFESLGMMIKGVFGSTTVEAMQHQAEGMEKVARDLKTRLDEIWSSPSAITVTKPGGVDARAMNEGLAKAMTDQLKIIEDRYKQEESRIKELYGNFLFTEGLKTSALQAALQTRYADSVRAGENEKVARAKLEKDLQLLHQQTTKDYEKDFNEIFSGLQGAINGQLRGMLAGTVSFAQGFKAILGDMVIFAIQEIEKMAFKWAAHELAMTFATETGEATRAAASVAGTEASLPARAAKFVSDITASGAEAFAGVFGNLALLMGPAAAGPAAASEAAVLAQLGAVPKLAIGTDYVARTGLAVIHEGEKITPAQFNMPYTGQNSTHVALSINAVDAKSFATLLNQNPGLLSNLIKRSMRDGQLNVAPAR